MPMGGDEIFFLRATSYPVKRTSEVSNVSSFCMHASKALAACEDACRPPCTDHACRESTALCYAPLSICVPRTVSRKPYFI